MDKKRIIGMLFSFLPCKKTITKKVFIQPKENLPLPNSNVTKVALVLGGEGGRIEHALELYRKGIVDKFILSGGIGPYSVNLAIPESVEYAAFLTENGVHEEDIILETESTNTESNIEKSLPIIRALAEKYHGVDVVLITSHYHMRRAFRLLDKAIRDNDNIITHWSSASTPNGYCEPSTWMATRHGCACVGVEFIQCARISR